MARRPRPIAPPTPSSAADDRDTSVAASHIIQHSAVGNSSIYRATAYSDSDSDSLEETHSNDEHSRKDNHDEDEGAPRVAQWEDDDEDETWADFERDDEDGHEEALGNAPKLTSIQSDLMNLPFGALRKAQQLLHSGRSDTGEDDADTAPGEDTLPRNDHLSSAKRGSNRQLQKRANKHAPTEITSRRPVTRKRVVVQSEAAVTRDPRFLSVAGSFSQGRFAQQYGFLADLHGSEVSTLRETLKRAKKLLRSAPSDTRQERAEEVTRLERALKRAESAVDREKKDKLEREALAALKKDEEEKRSSGKKAWHMKNSEKKEVLLRARYDDIAATGGKRAVNRVMEKKQKKIAQKEKRSRPFPSTQSAVSGGKHPAKRVLSQNDTEGMVKRRKLA